MLVNFIFIFTFGVFCQNTTKFETLRHNITTGLESCPENFGGEGRIVGPAAAKAKPNTWPWLVRIEMRTTRGRQFCGGTIIADQMVLTGNFCQNLLNKHF